MWPDDGRQTTVLITCEHGGNDVPPDCARWFADAADLLQSHCGYDIGALGVSRQFAEALRTPLLFSTVTRLLVDLNRSPDAPDVHGPSVQTLLEAERAELLAAYHEPYRRQVTDTVAAAIDKGHRILHVGVHSFTDILNNVRRELDTALLFDPDRPAERALCERWLTALAQAKPDWRHRFNEPYKGIDDGLTTWLRTRFADDVYAGVEVELRQSLITEPAAQRDVGDLLATTLRPLLIHLEPMIAR